MSSDALRRLGRTACLASILLFLGGFAPAWGDEVNAWFTSDPRAGAYSSAREELRLVFAEGTREQLPTRILAEKLREGASKGVPRDLLVNGLRAELGRLQRAQRILESAGGARVRSVDARSREKSLKAIGIFLRAGMPEPLIGQMFAAGSTTSGGEDAALAACLALLELRSVASIPDSDSAQIGRLLVSSPMKPSVYPSFAPVVMQARTRGLSDEHIVKEVIIGTLSSGGGTAAMIQKIESAQASGRPPSPVPLSAPAAKPSAAKPFAAKPSTATVASPAHAGQIQPASGHAAPAHTSQPPHSGKPSHSGMPSHPGKMPQSGNRSQ